MPEVVKDERKPLVMYTHRSGAEDYQRCPRRRWLLYHQDGTGVTKSPPDYLDIGSSAHVGLAHFMDALKDSKQVNEALLDIAVSESLIYFESSVSYRYMTDDRRLEAMFLITGLLTGFYYHVLPAFSTQWEVLEVEYQTSEAWDDGRVVFQSRPDVIVRNRLTNEYEAINWKTTNDGGMQRRRETVCGIQPYTEMYFSQKYIAEYVLSNMPAPVVNQALRGEALLTDLEVQIARYREFAKRTRLSNYFLFYLVKGPRTSVGDDTTDKQDISFESLTGDVKYIQDTPLCYVWVNKLTGEVAWKYRYWKPGKVSYNNLGKDSKRVPVWEHFQKSPQEYRKYIQSLQQGIVSPKKSSDARNGNAMDEMFILENPIAYSETDVMQTVSELYAQEIRIADTLRANENRLTDERLLETLTVQFPKHRHSCLNSPTKCQFYDPLCSLPSGEDIKLITAGMLGKGWMERQPHHQMEADARRK